MNIATNFQGALVFTDIVNGELVERKYMGYTKKEAKAKFKQVIADLKPEKRADPVRFRTAYVEAVVIASQNEDDTETF